MNTRNCLLTIAALAAAFAAQAKITMAPIFGDNMVLQRDKDVAVFGDASPNSTVKVDFAGQSVQTKAGADGSWLANLKPMKASNESRVMTVSESDGDKVQIKNVLVGEVWLCAGQSNMDCPLWGGSPRYRAKNGGLIFQLANYKDIRYFIVNPVLSSKPKKTADIKWNAFSADNPNIRNLSACGAFFGMQLYQSLGVPIGLMDSNWGGTRIEAWTPVCGFASVPKLKLSEEYLKNLKDDYTPAERVEMRKQKKRNTRCQQSTVLYNAMLNPFVPYTFRGAIWYQGCSNLGQQDYADKMHALYNGWSQKFRNPDLQFYFVQLSPYVYRRDKDGKGTSQPLLCVSWEQQRKFAKEQPNAHMVLTNDVGDLRDIHPYDKQTVGLRLAGLALNHTYGMKNIKADFPTIRDAKVSGNKVVMSFDNVGKFFARSDNRADGDTVRFMEIAGADGNFVPADVVIKDAKLEASAKGVDSPKSVRFLYAQESQCNVFNEYGLPLDSFKIDLK